MDAQNRRDAPALSDAEIETFSRFAFQQLVSIIDRAGGAGSGVGMAGDPERERLRFRAARSLGFPTQDIAALGRLPHRDDALELRVAFLGLYGPSSPLPPSYTEEIIQRDVDDGAAEDFFDFFNHRLIGFVHVLWRKYRYYLRYRRSGGDPLSARIAALFGQLPTEHRPASLPHLPSLIAQTGLLSLYSRSGSILAGLVADYFKVPARIQEFVHRKVDIPVAQRSRLGAALSTLGTDFVLSEQVADVTGKFRLLIGPVDFARLRSFLPDAPDHRMLSDLIRLVLREPLEWEIEIALHEGEAPAWRLGEQRLGWTTWVAPDDTSVQRLALAPWPDRHTAREAA